MERRRPHDVREGNRDDHPYNAAARLTMQLVHHFSTPGSVTLSCHEQDSDPDLSFQDLKITAIEGSSVSNVFLAMP